MKIQFGYCSRKDRGPHPFADGKVKGHWDIQPYENIAVLEKWHK